MPRITQLVLDILKPHDPNVVLFASHLAETTRDLTVTLDVVEVDDKTQTLQVTLEGEDIDLIAISEAIATMGASLHSIDGVQVVNDVVNDVINGDPAD
jgi:hypothetical protein